jgi:serine/threonine protein phosphatase PrpC
MSDRPSHLPPGTPVGEHYVIEGLVRLAEGRMFYLATDGRTDRPTRRCWECRADNPRAAKECGACSAPLADRRFLVSSRWNASRFAAYEACVAKGLRHPGLLAPVDVFRHEGQILSVVPYAGEGLMVDEAAPLPSEQVLDLGQRLAGTLAFLHLSGVQLEAVRPANLIINRDGSVRLFDLEVVEVHPGPVPDAARADEIASIGHLLRRYCDVEATDLQELLRGVWLGSCDSPAAFGRMVEARFDHLASVAATPDIAGMTDVGLVRQLNEDNWGWRRISSRARLFVVADGMGGHDGGEVASELAVETICAVAEERERTAPAGLDALEELFDAAFQSANNTIKDQSEARGNDMGTTLVSMLLLEGNTALVANVGDSRAYLFRGRELHQVTRDHSLVAKMVERGRITAEEARTHPHSNILLRTVGTERDVDIDIFRVDLESGDRILMCSDGLWGEVEDRDLAHILASCADPRVAARELVKAAHHGGGKDNVTVLVVGIP